MYLESKHPLNAHVWEQIPKYEKFTLRDVQGNAFDELRRKECKARNIPYERDPITGRTTYSDLLLDTPLDEYVSQLKEIALPFGIEDFVRLRGAALSMQDFVRVECGDFPSAVYTFMNFTEPLLEKGNESALNGVLACFFNALMIHSDQLLKVYNQGEFKKLYEASEVFRSIILHAKNRQALQQGTSDNAVSEHTNTPTPVVQGAEFVITTAGTGEHGGLTADNYESLIASAEQARGQRNYSAAARDYLLAQTLKPNAEHLWHTLQFIADHKLSAFYEPIVTQANTSLSESYQHLRDPGLRDDTRMTELKKILSTLSLLHKHKLCTPEILSSLLTQFHEALLAQTQLLRGEDPLLTRLLSDPKNKTAVNELFEAWLQHSALSDHPEAKLYLLLRLGKTPAELSKILQKFFILGSPASRIQAFLKTLPVSLGQIDTFLEKQYEKYPPPNKPEELEALWLDLALQNVDDPGYARTQYSMLEGKPSDAQQVILNAWMARTKQEEVRAVLSGDEQAARSSMIFVVQWMQNHPGETIPRAHLQALSPQFLKLPAANVKALLDEAILNGDVLFVNALNISGVDLSGKTTAGEPVLLALIKNCCDHNKHYTDQGRHGRVSSLENLIEFLKNTLTQIKADDVHVILQSLIQDLSSVSVKAPIADLAVLMLLLLEKCPAKKQQESFNQLLLQCAQSSHFLLAEFLVETHPDWIDFNRMNEALGLSLQTHESDASRILLAILDKKIPIPQEANKGSEWTSHSLNLDESYGIQESRATFARLRQNTLLPETKTDARVKPEIPAAIRRKLVEQMKQLMISSLSLRRDQRTQLDERIKSICSKLKPEDMPEAWQEPHKLDWTQERIRLLHERLCTSSRLPLFSSKQPVPNPNEFTDKKLWLQTVFEMGQQNTNTRVREVLVDLGWMTKNGEATHWAPAYMPSTIHRHRFLGGDSTPPTREPHSKRPPT